VLDRLIGRRENNMKKSYVKSHKEYNAPVELDASKILAAMKRYKNSLKKPTSVALDESTINELKKENLWVYLAYWEQQLLRPMI
jgi:hypothetical protein